MSKVDNNTQQQQQQQEEIKCTGMKNKVCKEKNYMRLCSRMLIKSLLLEADKTSHPDELFRKKMDCADIFSDFMKLSCHEFIKQLFSELYALILREEDSKKKPDELIIPISSCVVDFVVEKFATLSPYATEFMKELYVKLRNTKNIDERNTINSLKTLFNIRFLTPILLHPKIIMSVLYIYIYIYIYFFFLILCFRFCF